jgi:spore coat polysaccharide biosynthesis predicted glycosyltransferase SpsG
VNGNLYAPALNYEVRENEPTWCLGPDYAPLREEISRFAEQEPPWRGQPERALVTMGGSDVANETPKAVRAFDGTDLRIDVVVGPGFSNEGEIREAADEVTADTRVVRDPQNLPELMFEADFAIGACGSTTYELLALGTPLVCSPVVDNQEQIAAVLSDRDLAHVVDEINRRRGFRRGVSRYLEDAELRHRRRTQGRETVDGRGTERVSAEVLSIVDGNAMS